MPFRPRRRTLRKRKSLRKLAPKTANAVKAIVKTQMNRVIETKRADYMLEPLPINALYHNTWSILDNNCLYVTQGVQESENVIPPNRIGDAVYTRNLSFRCLFTKFNDRCNVVLRILILKVKSGTTVLNPTTHAQLNNVISNVVNTELPNIVSVAYDRTFVLNNNVFIHNTTGGVPRDTKFFWKHNMKVNQKIRYQDGSPDPINWTYRVYATMYDTQAAFTTDNLGRFSYARYHYFQDA